jgi:hypothetical protein
MPPASRAAKSLHHKNPYQTTQYPYIHSTGHRPFRNHSDHRLSMTLIQQYNVTTVISTSIPLKKPCRHWSTPARNWALQEKRCYTRKGTRGGNWWLLLTNSCVTYFNFPTVTNIRHAYLEKAFVLVCYTKSIGKIVTTFRKSAAPASSGSGTYCNFHHKIDCAYRNTVHRSSMCVHAICHGSDRRLK